MRKFNDSLDDDSSSSDFNSSSSGLPSADEPPSFDETLYDPQVCH